MRPEVLTASEAIERIPAGARVGVGGLAATPKSLLDALASSWQGNETIRVISGLLLDGYGFLDRASSDIEYESWFVPRTLTGNSIEPGRVRHLPLSWYQACQYLSINPVDIALIQVAPAHEDDRYSLGTSCGYIVPMIEAAEFVIAEVNGRMPYTYGDAQVPAEEFDVIVETDYQLPELPVRQPSDIEQQIAQQCAEMVLDSGSIQVGVGTIPNEVVRILGNLGYSGTIYSFLNDGFVALSEASTTGECIATVGEIGGTQRLYSHVDRNANVRMASGLVTHSPDALASKDLAFVNSCLEIDLFGQVNSEFIDGVLSGGAGGAVDFLSAGYGLDRLSVIAFTSLVGSSGRSRIVTSLEGIPTSISRYHSGIMITENGVRDLGPLSARDRADALIELADPSHQDGLAEIVSQNANLLGA